MIDLYEGGEGVIVSGPFYVYSPAYHSEVTEPSHNPSMANQLFLELGYSNINGVLMKEGHPVEIHLLVNSKNHQLMKIAKIIRQQLQEFGIQLRIENYTNYRELLAMKKDDVQSFHSYLHASTTGPDPIVTAHYWHSEGPFNFGDYNSSDVDSLYNLAKNVIDLSERSIHFREIHHQIAQDKPAAFLYTPLVYHAFSDRVNNPELFDAPYPAIEFLKDIQFKERR